MLAKNPRQLPHTGLQMTANGPPTSLGRQAAQGRDFHSKSPRSSRRCWHSIRELLSRSGLLGGQRSTAKYQHDVYRRDHPPKALRPVNSSVVESTHSLDMRDRELACTVAVDRQGRRRWWRWRQAAGLTPRRERSLPRGMCSSRPTVTRQSTCAKAHSYDYCRDETRPLRSTACIRTCRMHRCYVASCSATQ